MEIYLSLLSPRRARHAVPLQNTPFPKSGRGIHESALVLQITDL
jgi:hypothetical protein